MLRGVNVGGHNRLKMEELRAVYESLKLRDACTYVQSGNVVFRSEEQNLLRLATQIEDAIERRFGFRPDVILRTAAELKDVIARNPFAKRAGVEPNKLLVLFLAHEPRSEAREKLLSLKTDPDELKLSGREFYIYFPKGVGQSKLPAIIDRTLKSPATGRNWNSVTRMLEIAEGLESR